MEIKYTIQGLLIYATIAVYLFAFVAAVARQARAGRIVFLAGFLLAVFSYVHRWYDVQHVPLRSLVELSLCISVCAAFVCRWLNAGHTAMQSLLEAFLCIGVCAVFAYPWLSVSLMTWGNLLGILGCIGMCAAFACRWLKVRHIPLQPLFEMLLCIGICTAFRYHRPNVGYMPLQNLFEVFLFLGMICYPISRFCRDVLRIGGQWADMFIGAVVLVPAGFVFNAQPMQLPPALQSWLFAPHVAVYMLAYIFMAKAAFQAGEQLFGRRSAVEGALLPPEQATYKLVIIGFPLLTLGLILGSWWGKLAWGDYWGWDPKELWSLASWLVYIGYFHWRYMFGRIHPRINSLWAITGMAAILITLLWVNLSRLFPGLHSYAT